MQLAIDKARNSGVGVVTMRNSGHLGPVGHFAMQAANQDMIGVCMTAMSMLVLPTFGAEPRLGTNPISVAAPSKSEPHCLRRRDLDHRRQQNRGSPDVSAPTSNRAGSPNPTAPRSWMSDPSRRARCIGLGGYNLLPLGGTREQGSHKGFGLALMVEMLTTMLSGGVPSMLKDRIRCGTTSPRTT